MNWETPREPGLKEVIDVVEAVFAEAKIDFYYLIGAIARNYWFEKHDKATRFTRDIDFAIWTSHTEQFDKVKELLQGIHGFTSIRGNEFSLVSPKGVAIDILPFGEVEVDDGVKVSGLGLQNIRVNGFREVSKEGIKEVEIDSHKFNVATLPAIVLLKLIAYDDRPDQRGKDPEDIAHILRVYFDIEDEYIYDQYPELLPIIDRGRDILAARVVGREMGKILAGNTRLTTRMRGILTQHLENEKGNPFIDLMAKSTKGTIERNLLLITELQQGISDCIPTNSQEDHR